MTKKPFDEMLKDELDKLPKEISPSRDLWPGIERAMVSGVSNDSKPRSAQPWIGIAACVGAAFVSFIMVTKQAPSNANVIADIFEDQKNSLLVKYQTQPALTDNWQAQLVELESAEAAIRKALEADPQNAALLRMLSQVYQQQLDLINKVHQPTWQEI